MRSLYGSCDECIDAAAPIPPAVALIPRCFGCLIVRIIPTASKYFSSEYVVGLASTVLIIMLVSHGLTFEQPAELAAGDSSCILQRFGVGAVSTDRDRFFVLCNAIVTGTSSSPDTFGNGFTSFGLTSCSSHASIGRHIGGLCEGRDFCLAGVMHGSESSLLLSSMVSSSCGKNVRPCVTGGNFGDNFDSNCCGGVS